MFYTRPACAIFATFGKFLNDPIIFTVGVFTSCTQRKNLIKLQWYNVVFCVATIMDHNINGPNCEKYCVDNFSPVKSADLWHLKDNGCFEIFSQFKFLFNVN